MKELIMPRLENWSVILNQFGPYEAPEQHSAQLRGNVFNHPRFEDGEVVITSLIVKEKNGMIVTHSGSHYTLGEVDAEYERLYPDAKNRLIKSLRGE